jgi:hypothetical protein
MVSYFIHATVLYQRIPLPDGSMAICLLAVLQGRSIAVRWNGRGGAHKKLHVEYDIVLLILSSEYRFQSLKPKGEVNLNAVELGHMSIMVTFKNTFILVWIHIFLSLVVLEGTP